MLMPRVIMAAMVAAPAVSAAFGLEGGLHLYKIRFEVMEHILDHMVGANAKSLIANFSRQMSISQMPSKTHELIGIFVPNFDNRLRCGPHGEQSPVFKLQRIPIGHRNCFREVEKDIFALIGSQANAAAMARVEIESDRASRPFLRPVSGGAMNRSAMHRSPQYMK
jgi:hypothetical protein